MADLDKRHTCAFCGREKALINFNTGHCSICEGKYYICETCSGLAWKNLCPVKDCCRTVCADCGVYVNLGELAVNLSYCNVCKKEREAGKTLVYFDPDWHTPKKETKTTDNQPIRILTGRKASLNPKGGKTTLDQQVQPKKIRIMVWNIETLGGGFRQPPKRPEPVMDAIAKVIRMVDPDICGILEVMTKAPYARKGKRKVKRKQATTTTTISPGREELDRLVAKLGSAWQLYCHAESTGSETYAFLYKGDAIAISGTEYVTKDADDNQLYFPTARHRRPFQAVFTCQGRLGTKKSQTGQWGLPVVLFHAPAPQHGEETVQAIQNLAKAKIFKLEQHNEAVVAADTNVDTGEVLSHTVIDSGYRALTGLAQKGFFDWTGCEIYPERTTLRRSTLLHEEDEWEEVQEEDEDEDLPDLDQDKIAAQSAESRTPQSTKDFRNACYDKLLLCSATVEHEPKAKCVLDDPKTYVFDVLAAVSPQAVLDQYEEKKPTHGASLFDLVKDLYGKAEKELTLLDTILMANRISDHLPLYMDAEIL